MIYLAIILTLLGLIGITFMLCVGVVDMFSFCPTRGDYMLFVIVFYGGYLAVVIPWAIENTSIVAYGIVL
jgi:hypothetical protein